MATATSIASSILTEAAHLGGETWVKISKATKIYTRGYAQSLIDIAAGVAKGEISVADGKIYARNARFLLSQLIANVSQIVLHEVQNFLNKVLGIIKDAINAALGIALL